MRRRTLKLAFLWVSKYLGLFRVSRWLTRRHLRIICYHGMALADEAAFLPTMFIQPGSFERRLRYLSQAGYAVLPLEEAVERLRAGTLPRDPVVLTIDDGFYGTYRHSVGLLKQYRLPATLYVTTYYSEHQNPIFRLLVRYIFWRTTKNRLNLDGLAIQGLAGEMTVRRDALDDGVLWKIIEHGETRLDEGGRQRLGSHLAALLDVDIRQLVEARSLGLMSPGEVERASREGVDIQLHSHRHRFPLDEARAKKEILDNRAVLEPLVGKPLNHFCYPSGFWSEAHLPWLAELGIKSATTCDAGFNGRDAHPLALRRVFDSSVVSDLQFEAELVGYLEVLRQLKAFLARRRRRSADQRAAPAASPMPELNYGIEPS